MEIKHSLLICAICAFLPSPVLLAGETERVKGIWNDVARYPATIGLKFHVLIERPDGSREQAPANEEFHSGDRLWLQMEARTPSVVYVLNNTQTGDGPLSTIEHLVFGPEHVMSNRLVTVPRLPKAMRLDNVVGIEKLLIVVAQMPRRELEAAFDENGLLRTGRAGDGTNSLSNLLRSWEANADCAFPAAGAKGAFLDPDGYSVGHKDNIPIVVRIELAHSR
jgi:hypothetical protein